jgi:hypothetical protein
VVFLKLRLREKNSAFKRKKSLDSSLKIFLSESGFTGFEDFQDVI